MCQDVSRAANFTGKIGDPNLLVPPSPCCPALAQVHMKNNRVQETPGKRPLGSWIKRPRGEKINRYQQKPANSLDLVGTGESLHSLTKKLRQLPPPSPPFDQLSIPFPGLLWDHALGQSNQEQRTGLSVSFQCPVSVPNTSNFRGHQKEPLA